MSDTITVVGNIATAPRRTVTQNGVAITSFRVASAQRRFDRATGSWVDGQTNWYGVSAFRALAENAYQSMRKGDRVIVTGRLRLRQWDANGQKGMTAEIDADAIGPDLLWGTTEFTRSSVHAAESGPAVGTREASADVEAAWAIPGDDGAILAEEEALHEGSPVDIDPESEHELEAQEDEAAARQNAEARIA